LLHLRQRVSVHETEQGLEHLRLHGMYADRIIGAAALLDGSKELGPEDRRPGSSACEVRQGSPGPAAGARVS
jgi:hypothetical protein